HASSHLYSSSIVRPHHSSPLFPYTTLFRSLGSRKGKERTFEIRASRVARSRPRFAVWDLEDFAVRRRRIYGRACDDLVGVAAVLDRKSTRLNSSHQIISYAVFCLKKKKNSN